MLQVGFICIIQTNTTADLAVRLFFLRSSSNMRGAYQPRVDIPKLLEFEQCGGMLRVPEDVGRRAVYGDPAGRSLSQPEINAGFRRVPAVKRDGVKSWTLRIRRDARQRGNGQTSICN